MPHRYWTRSATAPNASGARAGFQEHLEEIVLPAWQDYLAAEHRLSVAAKLGDEPGRRRQSYAALRHGAAAALFLHHFGDVVLRARPPFLPADVQSAADLQEWLTGYCTYLRTDRIAADVLLLADLVEGLRQAPLIGTAGPDVGNEEILVVAAGVGDLPSDEGKVDGVDQVVIQVRSGPRALTAVLQNVVDAWRRAAGAPIPETGLP